MLKKRTAVLATIVAGAAGASGALAPAAQATKTQEWICTKGGDIVPVLNLVELKQYESGGWLCTAIKHLGLRCRRRG
jgi:hypothetical protein